MSSCDRSSHRRYSLKKGVLKNFVKFTGKHLCQNPAAATLFSNFIKKETLAQVFCCEFCKISKNTFFSEHRGETASYVNNSEIARNTYLVKNLQMAASVIRSDFSQKFNIASLGHENFEFQAY